MMLWYLIIVSVICSVSWGKPITRMSNESYWAERAQLMEQDIDLMTGYDLMLNAKETAVNSYLMGIKGEEMQLGFNTLEFLPAKNFLEAKVDIDNSDVFRFIRQMPKGAALHTHDMALTSIEWVVSELTYWSDLYICNTTDNFVLFKFFLTPDETCPWKLVKNERENYSSPEAYDAYLFSLLSLYTTDVASTYPDINSIWEGFEQVFTTISGLVAYSKAWEAYLTRAMEEFMNDKIHYLEFRGVLPLLYEKDGSEHTAEETVAVYRDAIQNFTALHPDTFYGTRFIYAPPRLVDVDTAWGYVSLVSNLRDLFPTTVAGFDLVGQEDLGQPLVNFIDPLLSLSEKDPPIPVFYHAGETNWEGLSTDENIFDALLLNATRIGHGYAIVNHPELMERARQADTPMEVCPISNQVLMLVNDLRNHPMSSLAAESFPMVISSDDPAIWEATPLSHDFYEAFMGLGGAKADLRFLKKLALNSIRYSSLENDQKIALEEMWQTSWDGFISEKLQEKCLKDMEEKNAIHLNEVEDNTL